MYTLRQKVNETLQINWDESLFISVQLVSKHTLCCSNSTLVNHSLLPPWKLKRKWSQSTFDDLFYVFLDQTSFYYFSKKFVSQSSYINILLLNEVVPFVTLTIKCANAFLPSYIWYLISGISEGLSPCCWYVNRHSSTLREWWPAKDPWQMASKTWLHCTTRWYRFK